MSYVAILRRGQHCASRPWTGTGKTANLVELLSAEMPQEYIPLSLTFSAQTSANQTQDIIDSKMEKRRRGVYGPAAGTKYVLFVDDLNMPTREKYFAQPPIELLRQWCNYGGWYVHASLWRKVENVNGIGKGLGRSSCVLTAVLDVWLVASGTTARSARSGS